MIIDLSRREPVLSESTPVSYVESIRTDEFRGGLYALRAGAADPQQPHTEDEAYYVIRGRATFDMDGERRAVSAGSAILVPAGVPHRFLDIEEDLTLFVLFAVRR